MEFTEYELVDGWEAPYMQRFPKGQLPEPGVPFRVIEEEWDDSGEVPKRTVKRLELV